MTATEAPSPIAELIREHDEVVRPLLDRMSRLADLLDSGTHVSPDLVREGVELWKTYVHEVHGAELNHLQSAKSLRCGPGLSEVLEDQNRSTQRMDRLHELIEDYRAGRPHGRTALALALRSAAYVDRIWTGFEEEHPFACLAEQLSPEELSKLATKTRSHRDRAAHLEDLVRAYLRKPVRVAPGALEIRCTVDGCPQRTRVSLVGAPTEGFRLSPLGGGWVVREQSSEGRSDPGTSTFAFFCPTHGGRSDS